ncbi:MAG TPA: hypothetical protein VNV66_22325 [Pilimelia sp.]|nr:hypothetical protein [Pilimelia sp.]
MTVSLSIAGWSRVRALPLSLAVSLGLVAGLLPFVPAPDAVAKPASAADPAQRSASVSPVRPK